MKHRIAYILLAITAFVTISCGHKEADLDIAERSVYYWRTVFKLDSTERQFLAEHQVERMYVRYFDVVDKDHDAMPNATIRFDEPVPQGIEIVPTVFIMENCLPLISEHQQELVDRILQMNETNDIAGVKEVQIDCDWTSNSQEQYYDLLKFLRTAFKEKGIALSATIRLHQLSMTPPPVDYGVLMMYNTGSLKATNGHNPILDYRDVYPYLKNLGKYKLPLAAAWPCYSWNLLYSGNQFRAILYNANMADSTLYRETSPGRYAVISSNIVPEPNSDGSDLTWTNVGDSVITMSPTAAQITKIIEATEKERPGLNKHMIIYSLDKKSIENYDNEFFKTLFNR